MLRSAKSLGEISLFKEVGHDKLERLALLFEYTSFDEGDVIFRVGDAGNRFYVLHRGEPIVGLQNVAPAPINNKKHVLLKMFTKNKIPSKI